MSSDEKTPSTKIDEDRGQPSWLHQPLYRWSCTLSAFDGRAAFSLAGEKDGWPVVVAVIPRDAPDPKALASFFAASPDAYKLAINVETAILDADLADTPAWCAVLAECRAYMRKARGEVA